MYKQIYDINSRYMFQFLVLIKSKMNSNEPIERSVLSCLFLYNSNLGKSLFLIYLSCENLHVFLIHISKSTKVQILGF